MRISTAQMYNQTIRSIGLNQTNNTKLIDQLSSGKRVNTSADDPVAAVGVDNLSQQNALIQQFQKNIDYSTNRLALSESQLGDAQSVVSSMRDRILAAINGTLSNDERQGVADELRNNLEELLSIANSQDEAGNYIFAGGMTDTQPFSFDNSGNVVYSGDSDVRDALVAAGVAMATNVPGDMAFLNSPSAMGDFSVNYSSSQSGNFTVQTAKIANSAAYVEDTYSFSFADNGSGGLDLQIQDSGGATVATVNNFDPSNSISFNGIAVKVEGSPAAGDSFTMEPSENVSIFDTVQQTIALLENGGEMDTPAGKSKLAQLLNNFDSGADQIRLSRTVAGNNLKALESYSSNHSDVEVVNNSALSILQDLDYASAITEFEKQQVALNAVSSVFSKVGSVSLFDYL